MGASPPLRVLGIDPGTRTAGYGILDVARGAAPRLVDCGPIRLTAPAIPDRLGELHRRIESIIALHRPQVLAVETVFHGKSFQSVVKVAEARGALIIAGWRAGLEIRQLTPAEIKKRVTGNGRATKLQVQRMVRRLLGAEAARGPADVSDALAVALCCGEEALRGGGAGRPRRGRGSARAPRGARAREARRWEQVAARLRAARLKG